MNINLGLPGGNEDGDTDGGDGVGTGTKLWGWGKDGHFLVHMKHTGTTLEGQALRVDKYITKKKTDLQ